MFKNLFNKDKQEVQSQCAASAPIAAQRQYKPSKKKKNTYIVRLNTMTMPGAFELCQSTPLAVVKINGVETENNRGGFMSCTQFPNPGACQMDVLFNCAPEWRIIAGDKMSQTIIEYMDKESGKPALVLYPTGHVSSLIAGIDANTVVGTRLNHASRRDFVRQYNRITERVQIVNPLINARNKAMTHAPQHSFEAYAQFMAELDKMQIERANAIMKQRQH